MASPLKGLKGLQPGEPLVFDWPKNVRKLSIDNRPLDLVKKKFAFGSPDLTGHMSYLVGEYDVESGGAFSPPTQTLFIHPLRVHYPNSKTMISLRLPASVVDHLKSHDIEALLPESKEMKALLSQIRGEFQIKCWQRPLKSTVVSEFASLRRPPGEDPYYHTGVDFRAAIGTPVRSSASGKIVFAERRIIPGNMIVVDHGGGLYSRYMHLSEIRVQPGETVQKNQILGLSGATGRVEAPHLHWEAVWKGTPVNPLRFLAATGRICDPK